MYINTWLEATKKTKLVSSEYCKVEGQEAMDTKHRKLHLNITKQCFYCVQRQALEQIAHGGCGVSIFGNFQNRVGQVPGQPDSAVSKGLVGIDARQMNSIIKP